MALPEAFGGALYVFKDREQIRLYGPRPLTREPIRKPLSPVWYDRFVWRDGSNMKNRRHVQFSRHNFQSANRQ